VKITEIELLRLRLPLDPPFDAAWDPVPRTSFAATVVRVRTDEGLVGYGSGDSMDGFEPYRDLFVGTDPTAIARHVRTLESISFHGGRYWPLEAALWDLIGQTRGVPVASLFGNSVDRLPAYASSGQLLSGTARVESVLALAERGFRAAKIRVDAAHIDDGIGTVHAVRDAVGPDFALMVDMNQAWRMAGDIRASLDPVAVRRAVTAFGEADVLWVEEPLPLEDRGGLRSLRDATGVRIAGGEMVRSFRELFALVSDDALDVYQPDVVLSGGLSRVRTIAELALFNNRWFTPHTWSNGLGLMANLQVVAGVGGGPFIEFPVDPPGWTERRRDFFLSAPIDIDADGMLRVPTASGLGIEIDESALAHFADPS
jgi:L-alanine-DL-glutamate epimerase-like enolase superfamily enzyme